MTILCYPANEFRRRTRGRFENTAERRIEAAGGAGQSRSPSRGSARCYQCTQRGPRSPPTTGDTTTGEQAARQEVVGGPSCGNQTRHCKGEGGEGITNVMKITSMEFISDSRDSASPHPPQLGF